MTSSAPKAEGFRATLKKMDEKQRILIVDDEPQITRVLRRSLTSHGCDVRVAADGLAVPHPHRALDRLPLRPRLLKPDLINPPRAF